MRMPVMRLMCVGGLGRISIEYDNLHLANASHEGQAKMN